MTKQCRKCKKVKETTEFSKKVRNSDGLQSYCKACDKEYKDSRGGGSQKKQVRVEITENTIKMLNKRYPYYITKEDIIKEFGRTQEEFHRTFSLNKILTVEKVLRKWNTL